MTDPTLFAGGLLFDGETAPRPGLGVMVADGRVTRVAPAGSSLASPARGWTRRAAR
ncbi:hypothetical protein HHL28_15195 [Aerophototrophica crusticola]|uniref:Amidohydrolase 3 domain-containing protein n=1 Tax=Aerophototrophica crusticola TaxID=1709002 RepID=A0A858RB93_9PROT|nr:hypothetical protein HHL28_15195 [Rhodospirillaceae bacterium B3]